MPCSDVTGRGQIFWKVTATCKLKVQQDRQNTQNTDWQINSYQNTEMNYMKHIFHEAAFTQLQQNYAT